jgi:hypothetical protein
MNLVYTVTVSFFTVHFNIVIPPTPGFRNLPPSNFQAEILYAYYINTLTYLSFDYPGNQRWKADLKIMKLFLQ